jgi:hypothetical protein
VLTLRGASGGSLLVRDRTISIGAPSTIELTDVRALSDQSNQQVIPLPLSTSGQAAGLQFQGVGSVTVNGQSETTFFQRHESALTALTLIATVVAAAASAFTLLRGLRRRNDMDVVQAATTA